MKGVLRVFGAVLVLGSASMVLSAAELTAPDVTVGRNLEKDISIKLPQPAPDGGLQVTITSDDPARALISRSYDKAGAPSVAATVMRGSYYVPGFFVQGLADSGTVTYTVTVSGVGSAKGKITLVPSTIAILGPSKQASFKTTPKGEPYRITLVSATLDASMKVSEEQIVAGGMKLTVPIRNSNPEVGSASPTSATINAGESVTFITFAAVKEGNSTLSVDFPAGFRAPTDLNKVAVTVETPGIAVADDLTIGKDLQMPGIVCLGDAAGAGGLEVTLTSDDPSKLLLSESPDKLGAKSITLKVPAGGVTVQYYMQSLSESGKVSYQAAAKGFRSREGHVALAPSGMIVAYSIYGPPDEAAVLRQVGEHEDRAFTTSLADAKKKPVSLSIWSAYLDHGLAADFTVQALRPGISATVNLKSSNPSVGTVESPVTIHAGGNSAETKFIPLTVGQSEISIDTPSGFTRPKNAVRVPASIVD